MISKPKEPSSLKIKDALDALLAFATPEDSASMEEIVKRDPEAVSKFLCKICEKHKSKNSSGQVKNISGHFTSKTHHQNMGKSEHQLLDNEIRIYYGEEPLYPSVSPGDPKENSETQQRAHQNTSADPLLDEKALKIDLTAFMVKERLPFSKGPALMKFLQKIMTKYDQKIIRETEISKEAVKKIAQGCIGESLKQNLFEQLKSSPFSLSLDEASDFYKNSYLALCAKFLPEQGEKPVTKLISIIELKEGKTGEALAKAVQDEVLSRDDLIAKNFMGLVTDEAQSMVGSRVGLAALLKKKYEHLVCRSDISHKYHNICKGLTKKFPSEILDIINSITVYFRQSCQRRYKLKAIQQSLKIKSPLEILKWTEVRWLSLSQCINRILELWHPIKVYFKENKEFEELRQMSTRNQLQLRLIADLLSYLAHYNIEFQKTDMLYDEVVGTLEESLRVFGNLVFKDHLDHNEILDLIPKETSDIRILDSSSLSTDAFTELWLTSHHETNLVYQGYKEELEKETALAAEAVEAAVAAETTRSQEAAEAAETTGVAENTQETNEKGQDSPLRKAQEKEEGKENDGTMQIQYEKPQEEKMKELSKLFALLKDWIFQTLVFMKQRLPFRDSLSEQMKVVFLERYDKKAWDSLRDKFKNVISTADEVKAFELELKIFMANFGIIKDKHKLSGKTILSTWNDLAGKYKHVAKLAKALLVLPSSTVPVERVFSHLKDIKGPKRSRLTTDNLESALLIFQEFKTFDFEVTEDMTKRYEGLWKKKVEKSKMVVRDQESPQVIEDEDTLLFTQIHKHLSQNDDRWNQQSQSVPQENIMDLEEDENLKDLDERSYVNIPNSFKRALADPNSELQTLLYNFLSKKVKKNDEVSK